MQVPTASRKNGRCISGAAHRYTAGPTADVLQPVHDSCRASASGHHRRQGSPARYTGPPQSHLFLLHPRQGEIASIATCCHFLASGPVVHMLTFLSRLQSVTRSGCPSEVSGYIFGCGNGKNRNHTRRATHAQNGTSCAFASCYAIQ